MPRIFSGVHSTQDISEVMAIMLLILRLLLYVHAQGCARVWGMRYANECCYMLLWLGLTLSLIRDSWPRSWRGQDEKLRAGEQRQLQSTRRMWTLRSILGHLDQIYIYLDSWIWVKKESEPVLMFSLHDDVMVMLVRPWPDVMMTVSPFRHLVVTNKSYKNPQLIRSDSVQNSFFLPPGRSCWGWFIAMSQTVRVEIDWKKSENYFKNYLQLIEDDTRS